MWIEKRMQSLGLTLPRPITPAAEVRVPFSWVRVRGNRAYISGHGPVNADGTVAGPFGKVGVEVSVDEAYLAARSATLAILASLQRVLGDLDRITAWLDVRGLINVAPEFTQTTQVMNGCSDLLLDLFGEDIGQHARSAIGVTALPMGVVVTIAGEVELTSAHLMMNSADNWHV